MSYTKIVKFKGGNVGIAIAAFFVILLVLFIYFSIKNEHPKIASFEQNEKDLEKTKQYFRNDSFFDFASKQNGNYVVEKEIEVIDKEPKIEVVQTQTKEAEKEAPAVSEKSAVSIKAIQRYPKRYANANEKWTKGQEKKLIDLKKQGLKISEIAKKLKRKPGAIKTRLKRLKLG